MMLRNKEKYLGDRKGYNGYFIYVFFFFFLTLCNIYKSLILFKWINLVCWFTLKSYYGKVTSKCEEAFCFKKMNLIFF
jgi:hypothetical protein